MRKRCRRIIRHCEEMIATVEWWNRNRTECEPMDCEPERVLLPVARACLNAIDAGDMTEAGRLAAKMAQLGLEGVA